MVFPAVPAVQIAFAVLQVPQLKRFKPAKSVHNSTSHIGVARKTRGNQYDSAVSPAHLVLENGTDAPARQ